MTPLALGLTEVLRQWKLILVGVLLVALFITRATLADEKKARADEQIAHRITVANYRIAQAQATLKALEQRRAIEDKYRRNADEAQAAHVEALADADARTAEYIRANRLRGQGAECPASGADASAAGERAGVPAGVSAPSIVAVSADDVRACSAAAQYALSAFQWAQTLNQGDR